MNYIELVRNLVALDREDDAGISRIQIVREPDKTALWVAADCAVVSSKFLRALLSSFQAVCPGTLVLSTHEGKFISEDGFPLQHVATECDWRDFLEKRSCPQQLVEWFTQRFPNAFSLLVRLPDDNSALDNTEVQRVLLSETWLASRVLPHFLAARELQLAIGAWSGTLRCPQKIDTLAVWQNDQAAIGLFHGDSSRKAVPLVQWLASGEVLRTQIAISQLADAVDIPSDDLVGFDVRSDIDVEIFVYKDGLTANPIDFVLESIAATPATRNKVRDQLRASIESAYDKKRNALVARRESLSKRNVIRWGGPNGGGVAPVPQCETEVIILTVRLESLIALRLGCFEILEHTSREGIDAIVRMQLSKQAPKKDEFVEFEFVLSNFFDHGHPIRQTACIVCWTVDPPSFSCATRRGWTLSRHPDSWTWLLRCEDHLVRVLPLSTLPEMRHADS